MEKIEKYFKMSSAEIFTRHAKVELSNMIFFIKQMDTGNRVIPPKYVLLKLRGLNSVRLWAAGILTVV